MVPVDSPVRQADRLTARCYAGGTQLWVTAMGFNPGTGMTPNDWSEQEARRAERVQRVDSPHGREISPRSRAITAWVIGLLALALIFYAILGWAGVVMVPGINA